MNRARSVIAWESLIRSERAGALKSSARALLAAASMPYSWAVRLRNAAYDRGVLKTTSVPLPVVSIGNLSVGGSGKTPLVLWCARKLSGKGLKPAILSRGYGRVSGGPVVTVADGSRILADARTGGDEPVLLAKKAPGVPVIVAADRLAGAREAQRFHPDVLLLDDGFQHRRLHRDCDLVCLDEWVLDAPGLFPRGVLREPARGLSRAQALILKTDQTPDRFLESFRRIHGFDPGRPVASFRYRPVRTLRRPEGDGRSVNELKGRRILAFSGIAHPEGFERLLKECGAEVVATRRFADHEPYSSADLNDLTAQARRLSAELATTEKDAERIPDGMTVTVIETELEWTSGESELEGILSKAIVK